MIIINRTSRNNVYLEIEEKSKKNIITTDGYHIESPFYKLFFKEVEKLLFLKNIHLTTEKIDHQRYNRKSSFSYNKKSLFDFIDIIEVVLKKKYVLTYSYRGITISKEKFIKLVLK